REISYFRTGPVGVLTFDFYNGAMSTGQCERLAAALRHATTQATRVLVLRGGEVFSNGIHLNVIEAAEDPAIESWWNLLAIDDVVRDIVETDSHVVISALAGDAAAGGVPFALAADYVVAREDVVLNPYYQHMGGLYGSEYWTYLLPRRVGGELTARLTSAPFTAVGARQAVDLGLLDSAFGATVDAFRARVGRMAEWLARDSDVDHWLASKRRRRARDEQIKPLSMYRKQELARSHECFFGEDRSYHEARRRFVYKLGAPCAVTAAPRLEMPDAVTALQR
ncbi:MAG TPA: enoyl-CoA hydratase/isomerase family protein, partial [Solirubrobacteraceae bacterium]